jgi:hypothetical protein
METATIQKNGVSSKGLITSRRNCVEDMASETLKPETKLKPVKRIFLRVIGNVAMLALL